MGIIFNNGQPWRLQPWNTYSTALVSSWNNSYKYYSVAFAATFVTKNWVYQAGGYSNSIGNSNVIIKAPISNGVVGNWSIDSYLPTSMRDGHPIMTLNRIYLLCNNYASIGEVTTDIYTCTINSDGSISEFELAPISMPAADNTASVIVIKNRLYILGGSSYTYPYYFNINADGTLSEGAYLGTIMGNTTNYGCAFNIGNTLYYMGYSSIYKTTINTDGSLGSWSLVLNTSYGFSRGDIVVTKNKVYIWFGNSVSYVLTIVISGENLSTTQYISVSINCTELKFFLTSSRLYIGGKTYSDSYCYYQNFTGGYNDYLELSYETTLNVSSELTILNSYSLSGMINSSELTDIKISSIWCVDSYTGTLVFPEIKVDVIQGALCYNKLQELKSNCNFLDKKWYLYKEPKMEYVGNKKISGQYYKIDDIESQFNGIKSDFVVTVDVGKSIDLSKPENLIININNNMLEAGVDYNVNNDHLIFTTPPLNTDRFYGVCLGPAFSIQAGTRGLIWNRISTDYSCTEDNGYLVDTRAEVIQLNLPSNPKTGSQVGVIDAYSNFHEYYCIISGVGKNIEGSADALILNTKGTSLTLIFSDQLNGWTILTEREAKYPWESKSNTFSCSSNTGYFVDTKLGGFLIALPSNPKLGDTNIIIDTGGYCSLNSITVTAGERVLENSRDIMEFDSDHQRLTFLYTSFGWTVSKSVEPVSHPNKPYTIYPVNNSIDVLNTVRLEGSDFNIDNNDTHWKTRWQLSTTIDFTEIKLDYIGTNKDLYSCKPPLSVLTSDTDFYMRIKHCGNISGWSSWSEIKHFKTKNMFYDLPVLDMYSSNYYQLKITDFDFSVINDNMSPTISSGISSDFNNDDTLLAIGISDSPGLWIYQRNINTWEGIEIAGSLSITKLKFDNTGQYLACQQSNNDFIVYKVTGTTLVQLAYITDMPAFNVTQILWITSELSDSQFLVVGGVTDNAINIYKMNVDETFTLIYNNINNDVEDVNSLSYDANSNTLLVGDIIPKLFYFYEGTLTKLDIPVIPNLIYYRESILFNYNNYMLCSTEVDESVCIYKNIDNKFIKLKTLNNLPMYNTITGIRITKNGKLIIITLSVAPYILLWKFDNDIITNLSLPVGIPLASHTMGSFSKTGY